QRGQESIGEAAAEPAGRAADGAGLGRGDGLRGGWRAVLERFGRGHGGHGLHSAGAGPRLTSWHRAGRCRASPASTQPVADRLGSAQSLSQIALRVARSSATPAASSAPPLSVIEPRRRVKSTSQRDSSSGSTRSGLSTDSPLGRVTVWSITPYSFSGTKLISTRPIGEFIDHWETSRCTSPPARPAAQRGRFRGSLANSYTVRQ